VARLAKKHNYSMGKLKKKGKKMQDPRNPKFGGGN
jgi:hypothetical protein